MRIVATTLVPQYPLKAITTMKETAKKTVQSHPLPPSKDGKTQKMRGTQTQTGSSSMLIPSAASFVLPGDPFCRTSARS